MPLGSGALAGSPFNIDRRKLAELLGFKAITGNSMNAVSDRDFIGEFNCLGVVRKSRQQQNLVTPSSNLNKIFNSKTFA